MSDNDKQRKEDGASSAGEGFRVEDRRRFDPQTGDTRRPDGPVPSSSDDPDHTSGDVELPGGGVLRGHDESKEPPLPIGFADLVRPFLLMGLNGLGIVPHPETGEAAVSLPTASGAIEILELLRERTEGNRTDQETRLLDEALFELKMQYVEVQRRRERR
ncbi:MAG: DUF1844 domain-containing protein [Acidobacteriota bacterium]|nr:MAG: DUF1844 domain-containing protein [Acidobacteriota bacterium]